MSLRGWLLLFVCAQLACAQSKPLVMEHADSLYVDRAKGYLVLEGNVRFRHDSVQFTTQRAFWNRETDIVKCEGGFLFTHPKGFIKANAGEYRRKEQRADMAGSVVAKDSAGEGTFLGERAIYDRKNDFLDLPLQPVLLRFQKDTAKKAIDTLKLVAQRITYDRKKDFAIAYRNVKVTRGDLVVTCDTGWFDQKNGSMVMVGKPKCVLKENQLSGDSMHIVLDVDKEKLKTVRVVRNALGTQDNKPKPTDPLQHTKVQGDTIFAEFANDKMKQLFVSLNARGEFWEEDAKDYINKMNGSRLHLAFDDGQMKDARVQGGAKSTYWYLDNKRVVSGRNEAMGDTIFASFDSSKVQKLRIVGTMATGVFYDLSKKNAKDSLLASAGIPTGAKPPSSTLSAPASTPAAATRSVPTQGSARPNPGAGTLLNPFNLNGMGGGK